MALQDRWTEPFPVIEDFDFGSSPTLFSATLNGVNTAMVGACNKTGVYYAWKANALSAGPVWQDTVGKSAGTGAPGDCITSAAFDPTAKALWVAANQTTVAGKAVQGAVREINPATGAVIWAQPLGCVPYGSPTLNGTTHVLAVPLFGCTASAKPGWPCSTPKPGHRYEPSRPRIGLLPARFRRRRPVHRRRERNPDRVQALIGFAPTPATKRPRLAP